MAGFGVDRGSGSSAGSPDSTISESLIDAKGDLIVGTADNTAARLAVGTNEQRLVADSAEVSGLKYVADTTNYAIAAKGDLLVGTAADTLTALTAGADYMRLAARAAATNGVEWVADTQNSVVTTKGDILVATANRTITRLAVGTDNQVPIADSSQASGIRWGDSPTNTSPHRQTQLAGAVDSSGYNATISAGAGLNFNIDATPTNAIYTFAGGFNSAGASDLVTVLSADASNQGSLNANNTHYLHATRSSSTAVTWGQSLIPPQYGYAFDRTQGALLNFEGADASTTMADDFGNTWTASGNAQIDTAQSKFGSSSLLLDGTGDYIDSTSFTTLGDGSWEISLWFRINALPGVGTTDILFNAGPSAAAFGVQCGLTNTGGTTRLTLWVSSNASSFDIVNGTGGTNTTWNLNQWNKARVVFDALAGTYRVYLSLAGAAETQDQTTSSTSRVAQIARIRIGYDNAASAAYFDGWIDAFRLIRAATVTTTETPGASAPTITDYPVHFFSIPAMTMYEVTAASAGAGSDPTLTARTRVFVGEADTGAATVSALRNYALRGEYFGTTAGVGASTAFTLTHNLGVPREFIQHEILGRGTGDSLYMRWSGIQGWNSATSVAFDLESSGLATLAGTRTYRGSTGTGGVLLNGTTLTANYQFGLRSRRSF